MIKFETKISDDSYSVAVASMAEQVLEDLLETLHNIDPSEVQIEGLRKFSIFIDGSPRPGPHPDGSQLPD